jgi:hypothetical protein
MNKNHPVTHRLNFNDHRAMADWWGLEALGSIRNAIATPRPATIEDLDMLHAVRATRMAVWHAEKVLGRRPREAAGGV